MKKAFNEIISRLDMAKARITELERYVLIFPKLKCKRKKVGREELWDNYKGIIYAQREYQKEKERRDILK